MALLTPGEFYHLIERVNEDPEYLNALTPIQKAELKAICQDKIKTGGDIAPVFVAGEAPEIWPDNLPKYNRVLELLTGEKPTPQLNEKETDLSHAQIALIAIYRKYKFNDPRSIEDDKYKSFLLNHGKEPTPGALRKNYDYYKHMGRSKEGALLKYAKQLKTMITDIEEIMPYLDEEQRKIALTDIERLKS